MIDGTQGGAPRPIVNGASPRPVRRAPRLSRADRTPLGLWFWEIDRVLLTLIALLVAFGLVAIAAASPVSAQKLSSSTTTLDPLYFFYRQLGWVVIGVPIMVTISMLPRVQARKLAILGLVCGIAGLFLVALAGTEVNGAQRWLGSGATRLQPSEFLKPCFAVATAWILSLRFDDDSLPVFSLTFVLTGIIALLLMGQPDLGQTILFVGTWGLLVTLAGLSARIIGMLGAGGIGALVAAYFFYPVATNRINIWLFGQGDAFQVEKAHATLTASGFIGAGPGAGQAKFQLPEAHTDYIFSVIGEELGLIACMLVVLVYFAILFRVLVRLLEEEQVFPMLAAAGLVSQFCGQAVINMAVNSQLFPSKGMTLPFISYGGSSFLALCVGMGLLLAITRRNPYSASPPLGRRVRPAGGGGR